MKTILIFVLVIVLAAVAFFTRPNQASFNAYYTAQPSAAPGGVSLKGVFQSLKNDSFLSAATYHDRVLWTTISEDDKTQYIGAFGHWFKQS